MLKSTAQYADASRRVDDESSRPANTSPPRIVLQYFRGHTLVCELRAAGESLRLQISPEDGSGKSAAGFRIESHAKVGDKDIVIGALGPTRRAAFMEMTVSFSAQAPELGLKPVDWQAVAVALTTVRALEQPSCEQEPVQAFLAIGRRA
jgi:hypothetical protein